MKKNFENENLNKKVQSLNLTNGLFNLIDGLAVGAENKWELLCFVYHFVVNGQMIDIHKDNDLAIDSLYPICRTLRKTSCDSNLNAVSI